MLNFLYSSIPIILPQIHLLDQAIALARHERIQERISLDEHVGLHKVDRVRVVAEDRGQADLANLVQLVLSKAGRRDVVLVPISEIV